VALDLLAQRLAVRPFHQHGERGALQRPVVAQRVLAEHLGRGVGAAEGGEHRLEFRHVHQLAGVARIVGQRRERLGQGCDGRGQCRRRSGRGRRCLAAGQRRRIGAGRGVVRQLRDRGNRSRRARAIEPQQRDAGGSTGDRAGEQTQQEIRHAPTLCPKGCSGSEKQHSGCAGKCEPPGQRDDCVSIRASDTRSRRDPLASCRARSTTARGRARRARPGLDPPSSGPSRRTRNGGRCRGGG
jgi:hypothetical protein